MAALPHELVLHGDLPDLGLQASHLLITPIGRSTLERGLPGLKEAVSPLGQRGRCDTQLSREDVELLTSQKT
jgi:hypothetical protein